MFKALFGAKREPLKEGRWKEFNKHAVLISVGHYWQGQKHGHWLEYYDSGELMLEEHYERGVPHGPFAVYYPNGNLLSEGIYRLGKREGIFRIYDETGIHTKSLHFKDDNLLKESDERSTVYAA